MTRVLASIVAVALFLVTAAPSHAAQVSQPMNVSLTIGTPGGQVSLVVGSLVLTGSTPGPASGSTLIHVTAPANVPYTISLDIGLHPFFEYRGLSGPSLYRLGYGLFTDLAHTQPWGDGGPGPIGPPVSGIGTSVDQPYTVYAETGTWATGGYLPGTYTDVVTVAVDF
jgi:spore coat protein U-like protein